MTEFLQSRFSKPDEIILFVSGMMSVTRNTQFQLRMQEFIEEYKETCDAESNLPLTVRHGTTLVVALRRFEHSTFKKMKRKYLINELTGTGS